MKASLAMREPERLLRWQTLNIYGQLRQLRAGRPKFVLHDGPPYANGNIHIGHAVNKILKDIIVRSHSMGGMDAPYVPGWDCHGLPIELNVEKKVGKPGVKVSATEFRRLCRAYAASQVEQQSKDFQRLGVMGDWTNPYLTMNFRQEADIVRALARLVEKNHVEQGLKPVHWCPQCASALAEAEVEYEDRVSPAVDVAFTVVDAVQFWERIGQAVPPVAAQTGIEAAVALVIWTTTPWTLPANRAVCLNAEMNYVVVAYAAGFLVVAEPLSAVALRRIGLTEVMPLAVFPGRVLEGLSLQHPFLERQVPVILGEHVTADAGTGCVHTAPAHGQEDYIVGLRYGLEVDNPVNAEGVFQATVPFVAGLPVFKANEILLELLASQGALLANRPLEHSYPHCWRHKTPIIFRATPQWFVRMDQQQLRAQALAAIEQVQWVPEWGKARIQAMVEQRPDWCISRQRSWGVPMPLFIHRQTQVLHPESLQIMEKVALAIEAQGIDAWFSSADAMWLSEADQHHYVRIQDTLDVWFDSGVTHVGVLERRTELQRPADLYLEGSDQHRGWFQSSLLTSVGIHGTAPYKQVLTHGFTVDGQGRKMAKSLGNVIAPQKIIDSMGADVLRLWVAATDYRGEMSVSDEILNRTAEAYRRIRNTVRYLLANLGDFDPATDAVPPESMLALDRWVVDLSARVQEEMVAAYETYQFHGIYHRLHNFCSVDLGSFYLDIIKDRQYTLPKRALARRSAQTAQWHIAEAMIRWMAPILGFTADEAWSYLPGRRSDSVHLESWYEGLHRLPDNPPSPTLTSAFWEAMIELKSMVNRQLENSRVRQEIGSGLSASVALYLPMPWRDKVSCLGEELRFLLITSEVQVFSSETDSPSVVVSASTHTKCIRCWHYVADVGQHPEHPELCGRCLQNLSEMGEIRRFV